MKLKESLRFRGLPDRSEIECVLELDLSGKKNIFRLIGEKITEKLEEYCGILDNLVQPGSNFSEMHEYEAFTDEDKRLIMRTYREVMRLHRKGLQLKVDGDEENSASFAREFWKYWPTLRHNMLFVLQKMEDSWKLDKKLTIELGYFG